jgi:hypothetical protein
MSDTFVQVPPNSTGEKIAVKQLSNGVATVDLQQVVIGDPVTYGSDAGVLSADPPLSGFGLTVRPVTSGSSVFHLVVVAGTNPTLISSIPGKITGWTIFNNTGIPLYVKFHNTATQPTAGAGVVYTVGVQAGLTVTAETQIAFTTGIGMTITEGIADNDTTALQANVCVVNIHYHN